MSRSHKIGWIVLVLAVLFMLWRLPRLHGQGFGSFSHDQPYLAKDRTSTGWIPESESTLLYYWTLQDLSTGAVATWTDRKAGAVLSMGNASRQPVADTNGVFFYGTQLLTNQTVTTIYTAGAGDGGFSIAMLFYSTNYTIDESLMILGRWGATVGQQLWRSDGNGILIGSFPNGNFGQGTLIGSGFKDFLMTTKNGSVVYGYTNNVQLPSTPPSLTIFIDANPGIELGNILTGSAPFKSAVAEIMIFTNMPSATLQSNIHSYFTNLYKFAP